MQHSPELLKRFSAHLAQLTSHDEIIKTLQLLRCAGLFSMEAEHPETGVPENLDRVGIWERKKGTSTFVRRQELLNEWHLWANVGKIEPKKEKLRIVFIGESAARGYLYDPQFTPAMALEAILQSQLGKDAVEVIDLARTDLSFRVRELAKSAVLLEPDAVIIFAGNNWNIAFSKEPSLSLLYMSLREQGIAGLKKLYEEQLAETVTAIARDLASTYASRGIPFFWIIPEFNLGDWKDSGRNVPHFNSAKTPEWMAHWDEAHQALAMGDLNRAIDSAEAMVQLDEGVSSAASYILAECHKLRGDLDKAGEYLEKARDSFIWDGSQPVSPRSFSAAQNALRRTLGGNVVDLPHLFREYLDGGIPDRRLFLDYCHLTAEGIRVAMAGAASRVLCSLADREVSWRQLLDPRVAPSDRVEAETAFLAAIHNAHCRQPYDVVLHHCLRSIRLSPDVAEVMRCFADFQSRRSPMLMCRSASQIAGSGSPLVQHYLFHVNQQQLDRILLDSITASLKTVGIHISDQIQQLRYQEFLAANGKTDLLEFYYFSSVAQLLDSMWTLPIARQLTATDYYRAYWRESKFLFVAKSGHELTLTLTCRLPYRAVERGVATLNINGEGQQSLMVSGDWETWDFTIPGEFLKDGVNEVDIHWPMPEFHEKKNLEVAAGQLLDGTPPDLYCIFGEIHSFTAMQAINTLRLQHDSTAACASA